MAYARAVEIAAVRLRAPVGPVAVADVAQDDAVGDADGRGVRGGVGGHVAGVALRVDGEHGVDGGGGVLVWKFESGFAGGQDHGSFQNQAFSLCN